MSASFAYWEERARRFAGSDGGFAAVCAYGMPRFYNSAVHAAQVNALRPWLAVTPGTPVLEVGCGVGRWSIPLARDGALLTGVDLSPTMLAQARRSADAAGVAHRCHFVQADVASLRLGRAFPLVLGVTVLQHVVEAGPLCAAAEALASHVEPGGRLVLLEAAPRAPRAGWNHTALRVRTENEYCALFDAAGLQCVAVTGVDPVPLKIRLLPWYRRAPRPLAVAALAAATVVTLPIERWLGRVWVSASWHKVFVWQRPS
jgi:SAM-dependent methyltransferase